MSLQQVLELLRAIAARCIGTWALVVLLPALDDRVDPLPGRFHLVTAHEQGRVTLDHVQQQPLVGFPAALLVEGIGQVQIQFCLLYTSPSPRDRQKSRMPSSA